VDDIEKENESENSKYNRTHLKKNVGRDLPDVGPTSTDSSTVINYLDKVDVSDRLQHLDQVKDKYKCIICYLLVKSTVGVICADCSTSDKTVLPATHKFFNLASSEASDNYIFLCL